MDVLRDALPEIVALAIIGLGGLLWKSGRQRLREVVLGPRLTIHLWSETIIDGQKRRLIPWPNLVVGLGRDPLLRGPFDQRLAEKRAYVDLPRTDFREMLVAPLYPLGSLVSKADSLVAVHLMVRNTGRSVLTPDEIGTLGLRIDLPSLHILDWSQGTYSEAGWQRSYDSTLDGSDPVNPWTYKWKRELPEDGPTTLEVDLRTAIRPGEAQHDVLAAITSADPVDGIRVSVSVVRHGHQVPLLVKPWRPAHRGERLRHPLRTLWRRLFVADRLAVPD